MQEAEGRLIAAICAAPTVLAAHKIALGKCVTSHPSLKDKLVGQYKYVDDANVVVDDKLITSRGPGTSFEFAIKLSELLTDDATIKKISKAMLLK